MDVEHMNGPAAGPQDDLRDIIASAGMGIWHIELIEGRAPLMRADATMRRLMGIEQPLTPEETYTFWFSRIRPEAVASVLASVGKMQQGQTDENTYLWEHPTLGERYVRCGGTAVKVPGGFLLRGYHYDVDEQVREEQRRQDTLRQALAAARAADQEKDAIHLALGSGDWSMSFDERGNMVSCTWSRRFRQMLGYDSLLDFPDELASWSDLLHPEDRERVLAHYWDVVRDYTGRKTYDIYYRLATRDRGERWFRAIGRLTRRADGSPVTFYGIFLDVDAERRSQLKEKEQNSAILEAVSQEYHTMWLVDKADLTMHFIRSNGRTTIQNAVNMGRGHANYDRAMTQYVNTYVVEEDRERVAKAVSSAAVMEAIPHQAVYAVNYHRRDDSGRVTYHQMAFADVGEGFILAYRDIDAWMREEEQKQQALRDAYDAAEAASHAKSDFLQTMSHDIRTPMNGIIGMTAIAASHINDRERVKDCLQKITAASRHLLSLINEVLDMSKIESGKVSLTEDAFNLSDLIDNMITMVRPQARARGHALEVNIRDVEHEEVVGDPLRVQQVFTNIMSNAVKYTPDGGRITVSIRELPCHQLRTGCYEFTFTDTGIGMTEEYMQHIFEPFTRAEDGRISKIQGTGLGMPIVKNIVRMMGGDIQVKSRINEGSTFTVTIYLKLQQELNRDDSRLADLPVLVADDDELSMESAVDMLCSLGMKADGVLSGKEAVARVTERHEKRQDYYAVILDWKMPGMDGVQTARAIRAEVGEGVPILILTSYDWSEIEQEARAAGVTAFISKPLFKSRLEHLFLELTAEKTGAGAEKPVTEEEDPLLPLEELDLTGYHCLLVEDNELNAEIACDILSETGLTIDTAQDGVQAVEAMRSAPDGKYHLVLMDIQMPRMNGYEATRAIRAMDRDYCRTVPIVAMTANAFADDVQAAKNAGMNEHVAKPLDLDALARVLSKWVLKPAK